jgi:hypothetical protein
MPYKKSLPIPNISWRSQLNTVQNPSIIPFTLWLFNIAMENGSFIDGLPIKNDDFPWLC